MKKAILLSALLFSAFTANAAPAKTAKQAAQTVEFRQAIFKLVKGNVGALGAMAKGRIPLNAATLEKNGMRIEQLSLMLEDYFATDTSGFDVKTEALGKIWKNQADFNSKVNDLTKAAANLKTIAKAGNESQYKSAIGDVFKTCKGCHDNYKKD